MTIPSGLEILAPYFTDQVLPGELVVKDGYVIVLAGEHMITTMRDLDECAWIPKKGRPISQGMSPLLSSIEVFKRIDLGSI